MTPSAMDQIGRYKILGEVGRGAMGIVYRAQDPAIGRVVAIKTIRLRELVDASERAKLRDRLMREAQSAGILSHPGIVTIYDVAEEGDVNYIAMEYVDGPTLERIMTTEALDAKLVLSVLTQTAAALDYAHKRGIVHRDIKPANIMLHERVTAKITDFGVARIQSHQLTQAGSMVGTPNYMSPEQIQGNDVNGQSDQFSLAVIAYELLTGEKPFTADSLPALAFKIVQDEPAHAHRLNPTLDWPADTVLKRALAKNASDRYPTCSDFAFALENACRASKNWKPITPGSLQSMPTMTGSAAATPRVNADRRSSPPVPVPFSMAAEAKEETPGLLRIARKLAVVGVAVGALAAVVIGGLQMFDSETASEPDAAQTQIAETSKPSPTTPPGVEDLTVDPPKPTPDEPTPAAPRPSAATEVPPPSAVERPKPQQPSVVTTRLVANPPGAKIVVDGSEQYTCTAPCSMDLPPGRHAIAATLDGFRRTLKIFETPADTEIFLNMDRTTGALMVRSEPRGASIIVDGQTRKEKTPSMLTLPTGRHSIEVVQDQQREMHEVVIREGAITNLAVNLQD